MNIESSVRRLCRCFQLVGFPKVTPECIRQAKIGTSNATVVESLQTMLTVLLDMLRESGIHFPVHCHSHGNSRELLIIFFYLLTKYSILDSLVYNLVNVNGRFKKSTVNQPVVEDRTCGDEDSLNYHGSQTKPFLDNLPIEVNKISSRYKQLKLSCSSVLIDSQDKARLIYRATHDFNNLNIVETSQLESFPNDEFFRLTENLERKNLVLKAFLKWKETESVFWTWLNSASHSRYCLELCKRENLICNPSLLQCCYKSSKGSVTDWKKGSRHFPTLFSLCQKVYFSDKTESLATQFISARDVNSTLKNIILFNGNTR